MSASILSKAFCGVLLNTYFNVKSVPIVNSLQDIIDNQDINIATDNGYFRSTLKGNNLASYEVTNDLVKRILKYQQHVNYKNGFFTNAMINDNLLADLIMGKTVLITLSIYRDRFMHHYKYYQGHISVAEDRRFTMRQIYFMVKRDLNYNISTKFIWL